jgi:hypothetical protein
MIGITTVEIVISAIRNAVVKFQSAHDSQTGRKTHASNLSYALYTVAEGASELTRAAAQARHQSPLSASCRPCRHG